jgi:hypothetical protein
MDIKSRFKMSESESIFELYNLKILDLYYNNLFDKPSSLNHIRSSKKIYVDEQHEDRFSKSIRHLLVYFGRFI